MLPELLAQIHLVVGGNSLRDHAARRAGHLHPVVHVVLLEHAGGAEAIDGREPDLLAHLRRRGPVHHRPAPDFHPVRPARLPETDRIGEPVDGEVGEQRAGNRAHDPAARQVDLAPCGEAPAPFAARVCRRAASTHRLSSWPVSRRHTALGAKLRHRRPADSDPTMERLVLLHPLRQRCGCFRHLVDYVAAHPGPLSAGRPPCMRRRRPVPPW